MRKHTAVLVAALAASTVLADPPKVAPGKLPPGYAWETNFEQAKLHAAESGKLLFIDFYTEWCPHCKDMDREAFPRDDVKKLLGAMIVIKINPELSKENRKIADSFNADSWPRLIILTPKGEKLREIKGSPQPDNYESSFTLEFWNGMVDRQNATPRDWKGMAKNIATLVMWYPDTKYGKEALRLVEQYKGTAEFTDEYNRLMTAHEIETMALKADAQLKLGKKKEAIETWKALRTAHPGTPEATEAEKQLKKLNVKLDPPADPPKK